MKQLSYKEGRLHVKEMYSWWYRVLVLGLDYSSSVFCVWLPFTLGDCNCQWPLHLYNISLKKTKEMMLL